MKYIYMFIFFSVFLYGCDKTDRIYFDDSPNVLFIGDSIDISWLDIKGDEYISRIECKLVGQAPKKDLEFRVNVVEEETDAELGATYQQLEETYMWPKDSFVYHLPVVLLQKDSRLYDETLSLTLELVATNDIGVNYTGNLKYKIKMSCQLIKPFYWDRYVLYRYFGEYSKVKHKKIVEIVGEDFPKISKQYKSRIDFWHSVGLTIVNDYFKENEVYDENGKLIEPWVN